MRAETLKRNFVGAVGAGCIGNTSNMVEHHGTRAFEIEVIALETRIINDILNAIITLQHFDDVGTTFFLTAFREHRINGDMSARMGGKPVIWKNGIRQRVGFVFKEMHRHARIGQSLGHVRHFVEGCFCNHLSRAALINGLKRIVLCGLRIGGEVVRSDHNDRFWTLDRWSAHSQTILTAKACRKRHA
ncbi:hypothetical protein FQZ97_929900 [compost metagenome]